MTSTESSAWSEYKWRERILRYQLRVKAETIKRLATKLEYLGDFPADTPCKLSQLIRYSTEIIGQHLDSTPHDQLMNVNLLLCSIAEHLRFVERSRVANTPWSMIQGTEKFLKQPTGFSSGFIIRPQWSYNYSLMGDFVEVYRTSFKGLDWIPTGAWEKLIGELAREKIYCISFPRIERLNCLLHCNWGHEVGHIIAAKWIESKFDLLWQNEETQIKDEIEKDIRKSFPAEDLLFAKIIIQGMAADKVKDAMQVAKQGLTELICDTIGMHLLGPAALAAVCEFTAPLALDESPLTCDMYPPWRYRIRLMVEECEKDLKRHTIKVNNDEDEYPGPIIEPFWNWIRETINLVKNREDRSSLQSNITTKIAYRVIEANWKRIRTEALQLLAPESTEPYHLFKRVRVIEDLVTKLEQDTPPNELGTWPENSAACLEDILNAAWIFKLKKMDEDPRWGSADDFEKLFRLVLKATEVSFVHSTFGPELKKLEK